jgi:hypothetical protein
MYSVFVRSDVITITGFHFPYKYMIRNNKMA